MLLAHVFLFCGRPYTIGDEQQFRVKSFLLLRFFFCVSLNGKIVNKLKIKHKSSLWFDFFFYMNFNHYLFEMELSSEIYF